MVSKICNELGKPEKTKRPRKSQADQMMILIKHCLERASRTNAKLKKSKGKMQMQMGQGRQISFPNANMNLIQGLNLKLELSKIRNLRGAGNARMSK
jgi:hypothetical protein